LIFREIINTKELNTNPLKKEVRNMYTEKRIKVLISMIGLDGHTTGALVVAQILKDSGIEVVYLGTYQTPEMIVEAAIQEDVDAIGISFHASNYILIEELIDLLRKKGKEHFLVFCGGTIPGQQIPRLKEKGVDEVFTPQSTSESIVNYIKSKVFPGES
jgi:methylmalonyl-CoA mutase C-terminal domain/subunit